MSFNFAIIDPKKKKVEWFTTERAPNILAAMTVDKHRPEDTGERVIHRSGRNGTLVIYDMNPPTDQPGWLYKGVQQGIVGRCVVIGYDYHEARYCSPVFDEANIIWI